MSLRDFLSKQFIDVIEWVEPEDGILAYRYPMQDREIQNGGKLTVRDSQMAVFVNEGKVADVFGPGLYTLNTQTLPILTYLMNWDKAFKSPFKSDESALGNAKPDHNPRQRIWSSADPRIRHLHLSRLRSEDVLFESQRNEGRLQRAGVGRAIA
jgi:hypothetical protein